MEKVLIKSRLDCPPPESRQLLKEKDLIIQKLNEKLRLVESNVRCLLNERDYVLKLFNNLIKKVNFSNDEDNEIDHFLENSSLKQGYYSNLTDSSISVEHSVIENGFRLLDDNYLSYLEKQVELANRYEQKTHFDS
jgi:hypothetical protein